MTVLVCIRMLPILATLPSPPWGLCTSTAQLLDPIGCDVWCASDTGRVEVWRVGERKLLECLERAADIGHPGVYLFGFITIYGWELWDPSKSG